MRVQRDTLFICYYTIDMNERRRRITFMIFGLLIAAGGFALNNLASQPPKAVVNGALTSAAPQAIKQQVDATPGTKLAGNLLETLEVKGRAPKTGYKRTQFSDGWAQVGACDMRNHVLARDLSDVAYRSPTDCTVMSGVLKSDPYTGKSIVFSRGAETSAAIQIDHIVAISDAWQTGAQQLSADERHQLYNDPLELIAVDGPANNQKGDGDAATWLPANKDYRCRYVARQIAVKVKYRLWVKPAERDAMRKVLAACPTQQIPAITDPTN